jgi:adenylate cyclase
MSDRLPRKLAAILYADVAGYSRLTSTDEDATHRALAGHLELVASTIEAHGGEVMHYAGDAVLARFGAVVDALSSAIAIQDELRGRNAPLAPERRVAFRIGVNLGDVIEDRGDIYGDGVNVAARLEALADPGGICVSEAVRTSIGRRLGLAFEDLGSQRVKNIPDPIRAYRVTTGAQAQADGAPGHGADRGPGERRSLVVLPFVNRSGDPEQEYFADGITEDIITDVSKVSGLFVIARNSSFAFKGSIVNVQDIAAKLGVGHVLEGSVRRAGATVRINVQLVDAESGGPIWAERYDRQLEDIFALQDEVTHCIVEALKVTLSGAEQARRADRGKVDTQAYDHLIRGRRCLLQFSPESLREARGMFERALEIDPEMARVFGYQAILHLVEYLNGWNGAHAGHLDRALELAGRGVEADASDSNARNAFALASMWLGRMQEAERAARRTLELDPSFAEAFGTLGNIQHFCGRHEEAIDSFERALRLDPEFHIWIHALGRAQLALERYEEAERTFRRRLVHMPRSDVSRAYLASLCGHTGREDEARALWRELKEINPRYSVEQTRRVLPYQDPAPFEQLVAGLRKAGIGGDDTT